MGLDSRLAHDMARVLLYVTLLALVALSLGDPAPEPGKPKGGAVSYGRSYAPQPSYTQPIYRPAPQPVYTPVKAKAKAPKFKLPKFELQKLPKIKIPKFELPKFPKFKAKAPKAPKKGAVQPAYYAPPQPVHTPSYSQPSYGRYQ